MNVLICNVKISNRHTFKPFECYNSFISDQLKSFLNAGISVQDIESKHKVSTLGMAVATSIWDRFFYMTQSLDLTNEIADLISKGANLDMKFAKYDTPIIEATKMNLLVVFEMLIAAGANIDKPGKDGNTAVHVSCIG